MMQEDAYGKSGCEAGISCAKDAAAPADAPQLFIGIVPMNEKGELLLLQGGQDAAWRFISGCALQAETGKEAARRLAKQTLGALPDAVPMQLLAAASQEDNHARRQLYLIEIKQAQAAQHTRWILPETLLSDEESSAALRRDALFDKAVGELSRRSGEKRVPNGRYRHFKGKEYQVLGIAVHSETLMPMVVYQAQYGHFGLWVRPVRMWNERVARSGYDGPRFMKLP